MDNKWAIVTGASSGIGKEISKILSKKGYNLILVARREDRLKALEMELETETIIVPMDLRYRENCYKLYEFTEDLNVEILVNNSGFGDLGFFGDTDLNKELDMIDVNVTAVQILTKKFLLDFIEKNRGYILNVASSAGLMPAGPYMSTYYASKSYVTSLTSGIARELKDHNSKVYIGALCPGPVDTEFNKVANSDFSIKGISAKFCAECAVSGMFKGKEIIVPSATMKTLTTISKFIPRKTLIKICGMQQSKKSK